MNNIEIYEKIEKCMRENNVTIEGYLKVMRKKNTPLLNLSDEAYYEFSQYFECLKRDVEEYDKVKKHLLSMQERGKLLEKLAGTLFFYGNAVFNKAVNCRTVTNEIDILVEWNREALQIGLDRAYDFLGHGFLCECKNYIGNVDVTYVGKFYSLMKVSDVKFGIIFSRTGLSGTNIWVDGKGLARKIALREKIYIIDVTWDDFERIYNKETNIFSIMNDKYTAMKHDISYDEYISKHEAEEKFKEIFKEKRE